MITKVNTNKADTDTNIKISRIMRFISSLILPLLIMFIRPFSMDWKQGIILGALILVLIWWTTGIVNRTYASIFLLVVFSIFGLTPMEQIFKFPLSSNFYMIGLSFWLSQGIVNSNVANRFSNFILNKYANTSYKLIFLSFIFGIALMFIIPQSFPRLILLTSIYEQFLRKKDISKGTREVLQFSLCVALSVTYMLFLNGDILLNYTAIRFGGIPMGWMDWARYMTMPSILTIIVTGLSLILVFRQDLKDVNFNLENDHINMGTMKQDEKLAIIIMSIVILLWITEPLHSINSTFVAFLGSMAMFGFKILNLKDLKCINIGLMIYLTAAFSIGSVMNHSGIAGVIYSSMMGVFPSTYSNTYIFILVLTVMALHMLLGSAITTLSVAIPILLEMTQGVLNPIVIVLLGYITVNMHYILPFQHVMMMIGAGNGYYSNKVVMRYGLVLTFMLFVFIFGFYIPWWRFMGLI